MALIATLLLVLGVVGLLLPILPGIPLLLAAALLFTANSPALRRRLLQSPRLAAHFRRWGRFTATRDGDGFTVWQRCKLQLLAAVRWLLPKGDR